MKHEYGLYTRILMLMIDRLSKPSYLSKSQYYCVTYLKKNFSTVGPSKPQSNQ